MKPNRFKLSLQGCVLSFMLTASIFNASATQLTPAQLAGLTPAEQSALTFIVEFTDSKHNPQTKFVHYHQRMVGIINAAIAESRDSRKVQQYNEVLAQLNKMIQQGIKNPVQYSAAFKKFENLLSPTLKQRVLGLTKHLTKRDLINTFKARLNA